MTDSDMPLSSTTPPVASSSPQVSTRASTRVRARVAATLGDNKVGRAAANVASDVRGWWLVTADPPSLAEWTGQARPSAKVPDSPLLRAAWRVDHWVTGLIGQAAAAALYLLACSLRYLFLTPLRRWSFLTIVAALITYWLAGR